MRLQLGRENMFRMECHNLRRTAAEHSSHLMSSSGASADLPIFGGIRREERVRKEWYHGVQRRAAHIVTSTFGSSFVIGAIEEIGIDLSKSRLAI